MLPSGLPSKASSPSGAAGFEKQPPSDARLYESRGSVHSRRNITSTVSVCRCVSTLVMPKTFSPKLTLSGSIGVPGTYSDQFCRAKPGRVEVQFTVLTHIASRASEKVRQPMHAADVTVSIDGSSISSDFCARSDVLPAMPSPVSTTRAARDLRGARPPPCRGILRTVLGGGGRHPALSSPLTAPSSRSPLTVGNQVTPAF